MVKLQAALTLGSALLGAAPTLAAPSNLHTRQNARVRENIHTVLADTAKRDCFLTGLKGMQDAKTGANSWEVIAGIHGMSTDRAKFVRNQNQLGYCAHISIIFPQWHRQYLVLFENAARSYCPDFSLPYWDWARDELPALCNDETTTIDGVANQTNPLYSYRFGGRPSGIDGDGAQTWSETLRRPTRSGNSYINNPAGAADACSAIRSDLNSKVYTMFTSEETQNWPEFSNKGLDNAGRGDQGYDSIETIHDNIHTAIGGDLGHMTYTTVASYDPLFWLHHCNVDRLYAMYQVVHSNVVQEDARMNPWDRDSSTVTRISDLGYSYAHANGNAEQVTETINSLYCPRGDCLGVEVPGVNKKRDTEDCDKTKTVTHTVKTVSKTVKKIKHHWKSYKWVDSDSWKNLIRDKVYKKGSDTRNKYTCRIRTSSKIMNKTYKVIFFGGETCKEKNWNDVEYYKKDDFIGIYSPFGGPQGMKMDNMKDTTVGGTVHLDSATYNWIGAGKLASTDEDEVVPYLKKNLCYKIVDSQKKEYEAKDVEGLGIDIVVTPVTKSKKHNAFAKHGKTKKCLTIY